MTRRDNKFKFECHHCGGSHYYTAARKLPDVCPTTLEPYTKEELGNIAAGKFTAAFDKGSHEAKRKPTG